MKIGAIELITTLSSVFISLVVKVGGDIFVVALLVCSIVFAYLKMLRLNSIKIII